MGGGAGHLTTCNLPCDEFVGGMCPYRHAGVTPRGVMKVSVCYLSLPEIDSEVGLSLLRHSKP
jgi:hypothetical protein